MQTPHYEIKINSGGNWFKSIAPDITNFVPIVNLIQFLTVKRLKT
jgi:hypothetical protein